MSHREWGSVLKTWVAGRSAVRVRRGRTGLAVPRGRDAEDRGWGHSADKAASRVPSGEPGAEQVGVGGLEELGRTGETVFAQSVDSTMNVY